ncbi:hypothetical protein EF849_11930 [Aeromonas jandaei]|nr:hypothetical protein [Aeromonas jandaei]
MIRISFLFERTPNMFLQQSELSESGVNQALTASGKHSRVEFSVRFKVRWQSQAEPPKESKQRRGIPKN